MQSHWSATQLCPALSSPNTSQQLHTRVQSKHPLLQSLNGAQPQSDSDGLHQFRTCAANSLRHSSPESQYLQTKTQIHILYHPLRESSHGTHAYHSSSRVPMIYSKVLLISFSRNKSYRYLNLGAGEVDLRNPVRTNCGIEAAPHRSCTTSV